MMYLLIDTCTAVITIDPSCALKSFEAYGFVDTTNGISKGNLSLLSSKSMPYQRDLVNSMYGVDSSKPNMTVITEIDLNKAIDIIVEAKKQLHAGHS